MNAESTVFIIDDDAPLRDSLKVLFESKQIRVESFASAEDFLAAPTNQSPACLVIDVKLRGMSGLELQQRLKSEKRNLPIIVITGHGEVSMAVKAMENGVFSFLEKPCDADLLWAKVQMALEAAKQSHVYEAYQREMRQKFAQLSPDERLVLQGVLEGAPNKKIASELDMGLRTVELRRSHIMKKTGASSLSELIRMALEVNFPNEAGTGS